MQVLNKDQLNQVSGGFIASFLIGATGAQLGYSAVATIATCAVFGTVAYPLVGAAQFAAAGITTTTAQAMFGLFAEAGLGAMGYLFYKEHNPGTYCAD